MKRLYNIEVEQGNVEIYQTLKSRGLVLESFKESHRGGEYKVLSIVADSEDMLALKLCSDVTIVDDPEAAGGFQTKFCIWKEKLKDLVNRVAE